MISIDGIREKAREFGVPLSTIERDYAQNWLLKALSSINMVLKGGTGVKKVYIPNYRFSDDLDFTLIEEIEKEKLENMVKTSIKRVKEESGVNFFEIFEIKENENGFEISIYFQITQRGESKTKVKIDITKQDNEKIILPVEKRKIIHTYSDKLVAEIKVYSLEEILAEKIRSLFQRTRPRDLYDVWYLWDKINITEVLKILPLKFRFKNIIMDLEDFEKRKEEFKNAWINSLNHQLKELPNFDEVFLKVLKVLKDVR